MEKYSVQVEDRVVQYAAGTSYREIAADYQKNYDTSIHEIIFMLANL